MERIHFANEVTPRELPSEEPYRSVAYPRREPSGQNDRVTVDKRVKVLDLQVEGALRSCTRRLHPPTGGRAKAVSALLSGTPEPSMWIRQRLEINSLKLICF